MTTFPGSPRTVRGGLVLVDPRSLAVQRVIVLQYNPDSLSRSLQVKSTTGDAGDRTEALRLTGPPVETIKLEAEIDATDQLEFPDQNRDTVAFGIHPILAALEMMLYPLSATIQANDALARAGTLEIAPIESALTLFIWSQQRILPVRVTEFSVTEESFDAVLNPIRAKVSLSMRVLNVNDLPFEHQGNSLFMAYHQQKERLARKVARPGLSAFGIGKIR